MLRFLKLLFGIPHLHEANQKKQRKTSPILDIQEIYSQYLT